ncbi:hypothetical protein [Beijerinckia sp. L45]|uniref:hypothetical protein n=1 Tax=Beijerinckia sp. L45 TaxID=1641855 RepID=UPI00131BFE5E|nr:hypothetical protein [Beijerinckia sp. L45]
MAAMHALSSTYEVVGGPAIGTTSTALLPALSMLRAAKTEAAVAEAIEMIPPHLLPPLIDHLAARWTVPRYTIGALIRTLGDEDMVAAFGAHGAAALAERFNLTKS